ncbi:MAG: ABC transporter substrate-binding protein [Candidatus Hodarchaeales archaeon]
MPFNSYAPFAYNAVYVAAKGIAAAGTTDGDTLLETLYNVTHDGASQFIKFNDLGEVNGRYEYVQLEGDVFNTFGEWQTIPYVETTVTLRDGTIVNIDTIPPNLSVNSPLTHFYSTDRITVTLSGADHYWYYIESVDSQNQTWTVV